MAQAHALADQKVFFVLDADDQPTDVLVREIPLRQVDDNRFELIQGFVYRGEGGDHIVSASGLGRTDLASIPTFARWFVGTYGRHTLAALLHDFLVRLYAWLVAAKDPIVATLDRTKADLIFRIALGELGVPLVRQWVMWSAVTLASRSKHRLGKLVMGLWVIAALAGTTITIYGLATGRWTLVAAAAGPLVLAPLWGRQWNAGVVCGYALVAMGPPTLAVLLVYWCVYAPLEVVVRWGRAVKNRTSDVPGPPAYRKT